MPLTISLRPEMEAHIREGASEFGITPEAFVERRLEEANLLEKISNWIEPEVWNRYRQLNTQRAEGLSGAQQKEFLLLNSQIEARNAERLERVLEIATLRGIPFLEAMKQLGIHYPII